MRRLPPCRCIAPNLVSLSGTIRPPVHSRITGVFRFFGRDGMECEEFIMRVREHAHEQEKEEDNIWIARFAGRCMADKALRWHIRLDEATRQDWSLLERALIARFCEPEEDEDGIQPQTFQIPNEYVQLRDYAVLADVKTIKSIRPNCRRCSASARLSLFAFVATLR
jgi:hypothetical protein